MPLDPKLQSKFNKDVSRWAVLTRQKLAFKLASLPLRSQLEVLELARDGRKPLADSLRSFVKKDFGQAEIIRFSFSPHGWFFDRGVGRGTPITSAGNGIRQPRPWIDAILEDEVEVLADIIVETYGDDIIDGIKIRG
jgi:hypothetical protein